MEKYGVETHEPEQTKTGAPTDLCRVCGQKAIRAGAVLSCPVHGTQPFEASSDDDRK